jgi:hypothetical protein
VGRGVIAGAGVCVVVIDGLIVIDVLGVSVVGEAACTIVDPGVGIRFVDNIVGDTLGVDDRPHPASNKTPNDIPIKQKILFVSLISHP